MSEPDGLSLSLDDLIKKHSTHRGGATAGRGGRGGPQRGRSVGGVRGGGISKVRSPGRGLNLANTGGRANEGYDHRVYHGGARGMTHPGRGFQGLTQQQQQQQHRQSQQQRQPQQRQPQQRNQQVQQQAGPRGASGHAHERGGVVGRPHQRVSPEVYVNEVTSEVVAQLKGIDIVTISPTGEVTLRSGGRWTRSTLDAMNETLNMVGISVMANGDPANEDWKVQDGRALLRFWDGMKLPAKGLQTATRARIVLNAFDPAAATASVSAAYTATLASTTAAIAAGILPRVPAPPGAAGTFMFIPAGAAGAGRGAPNAYGGRGAAAFGAAAARYLGTGGGDYAPAQDDGGDEMVVDDGEGYEEAEPARQPYVARGGGVGSGVSTGRADADTVRRLKAQGRYVQGRF